MGIQGRDWQYARIDWQYIRGNRQFIRGTDIIWVGGTDSIWERDRQYIRGDGHYIRGGDRHYIGGGADNILSKEPLSSVFPPTSLSIIWFCSTTFKMTHAKCIIMVMPMISMESIRNIFMKLWDTFIYMIMMCKYVISNEDTVPTYFDVWRFFFVNDNLLLERKGLCNWLQPSQ